MGIYWSYANLDDKEYLEARKLEDSNPKYPIDICAGVLHKLLKGRWQGKRIAAMSDTGDLPWDDYVDGCEDWTDVLATEDGKRFVDDWYIDLEESKRFEASLKARGKQ